MNEAYGFAITEEDLSRDGSDMITKRVEAVLQAKHGLTGLDKGRVLVKMLEKFDNWTEPKHLPPGTAGRAEKLFKAINTAFDEHAGT